jgi:uncharacterized LabA/DUF88 family protein
MIGLDIASIIMRNTCSVIGLVSGDSDLLPALRLARDAGVLVRLVHGPERTFHPRLWEEADERLEITRDVWAAMPREGSQKKKPPRSQATSA